VKSTPFIITVGRKRRRRRGGRTGCRYSLAILPIKRMVPVVFSRMM
jgi:hypothetical protein